MELRTHLSVIWRWRFVVVPGLALAFVLAFFSYFSVSFAQGFSVAPRQAEIWQSSETLLLTQRGLVFQVAPGVKNNPAWLQTLSSLYAQIAGSDVIRAQVLPAGGATEKTGDYLVSPVLDQNQQVLPVLKFSGTGPSQRTAMSITGRASSAFLNYLRTQTIRAEIPTGSRVDVQVLSTPGLNNTKVIKARKRTIPIVVFLTVAVATLALIYVLENLIPRVTLVSASTESSIVSVGVRNRLGSSSKL